MTAKTLLILITAATIGAMQAQAQSPAVPAREHRSLWSTNITGGWPSSALTDAGNVQTQTAVVHNMIQRYAQQNFNVLYYHVRMNCDANYNSAYEPWSSFVAGTRGGTPIADPLQIIIDEGHAAGLEVYAWLNPYRYANSTSRNPYGAGERNYENSHPDWLLYNAKQAVLNPALEEVQQRIVDIVRDILTKYDVDGIIFDDYFYGQGGTDADADAAQYEAYKAAGGKLSQGDWRRANVNRMIERVHQVVRETKPWVVFGVSPAGVASPDNIRTEYGLEPYSGDSDWQYNQIYSDPLAWLKAGTIDFISPQIYWPGKFDSLDSWWQKAVAKFGRHSYPSVDLSTNPTSTTQTWIDHFDMTRRHAPQDRSGLGLFSTARLQTWMGDRLHENSMPTKALTPIRPWHNVCNPVMTANVAISGSTLTWQEVKDMRYTVYAQPKTVQDPFMPLPEYLRGVRYTNSFELPSDAADYNWYVACYDRYGNEYSTLGVGVTAAAAKPAALVYPADNATPQDLFDFSWTNAVPAVSEIQIAADAAFSDIVASLRTTETKVSISRLATLTAGNRYYWRVISLVPDAQTSVSAVRSFIGPRVTVTAPADGAADVAVPATITWMAAAEGAEYTLEVSTSQAFPASSTLTVTTDKPTATLGNLWTGTLYYARVTAVRNGATSVSEVSSFSTVNRTDYTAPLVVRPEKDGDRMYHNTELRVQPWSGMTQVTVQISASNTFPGRSTYSLNLSDGTTNSGVNLEDISRVTLTDGKTYYVRTRGLFRVDNQSRNTDYSPVRSFVYSTADDPDPNASAGIDDITADTGDAPAAYYDLQGRPVSAPAAPGLYLRRQGTATTKVVVK